LGLTGWTVTPGVGLVPPMTWHAPRNTAIAISADEMKTNPRALLVATMHVRVVFIVIDLSSLLK
jgi:hypothetical protein